MVKNIGSKPSVDRKSHRGCRRKLSILRLGCVLLHLLQNEDIFITCMRVSRLFDTTARKPFTTKKTYYGHYANIGGHVNKKKSAFSPGVFHRAVGMGFCRLDSDPHAVWTADPDAPTNSVVTPVPMALCR